MAGGGKARSRSNLGKTERSRLLRWKSQDGPSVRSLSFSSPFDWRSGPERFKLYHGEVAGNFGFWVTVCFTINFVMGAGFLGVPKAFVESGYILGPAVMVCCALVCDITKNMELEACARAEAITEYRLTDAGAASIDVERSAANSGDGPRDSGSIVFHADVTRAAALAATETPRTARRRAWRPRYRITARKFEVPELMEVFFGRVGKLVYTLCLSLFIGGTLWAYASVFATSFSANIPIWFLNHGNVCNADANPKECWGNFHIWLAIFSVIVIPLSCTNLKEQRALQVIMAIGRFTIVGLLCGTVLGGFACDGVSFATYPAATSTVQAARLSGFETAVSVGVYALIMHQSIPVLAEASRKRGKPLANAFGMAFLTTCTFYMLIGLLLALYFGTNVGPQCNLMWEQYVGCVAKPEVGGLPITADDATWWARAIRCMILLFPAIDVLTASPLNAIVLGNSLLSAWAGDATPAMERMPLVRNAFRLAAATVPILGAFVVSNLDSILKITGVVGFVLGFFAPAALSIRSAKMCVDTFGAQVAGPGPAATPYRHAFYFRYSEHVVIVLFAGVALWVLAYAIQSDV